MQAVAEFQGQFMNSTDLATLFKNYVDKYEEGTDDVVYKWVGKHIENSGGVEAELDSARLLPPPLDPVLIQAHSAMLG
eukprot:COSAG01_NODE_784_length_13621_cov_68.866829_11_plen_78_part_00